MFWFSTAAYPVTPGLNGLEPWLMCLLSEQCGWAFLASLCTDGSCDCAHWDASAGGWPSGLLHTPVWHLGVSSRVPCPCGISSSRTLPMLVLQEGTHDFYFLASRSTRSSGWQALWLRWGAVPVSFPPHLSIRASHRASPDRLCKGTL